MNRSDSTGNDASAVTHHPKWEVYTDEHGNMYFYNTRTGETAWELPIDDEDEDDDNPPEDEAAVTRLTAAGETIESSQLRDEDGNLLELTVVRPRHSRYQIAVEVIETMLRLMDDVVTVQEDELLRLSPKKKKKRFVSPAAEKRAKKNDENRQKRRKRERLLAMTRYMNILVPPEVTPSAALTTEGKRPVGALFTREDARRWRVEREVQQIRQRHKARKLKDKHHQQVYARASHDQFLKQFRSELLKNFVAQIPCSTELQQQRILLLTSPQQLAEMDLQRKATLEPELLERYEAEKRDREEATVKNAQKVFVLADRAAVGSLHLLQTLLTVFSDERAQKYAKKVRGLSELITNVDIQRFVVDFVSLHQAKGAKVSLPDFQLFVQTIEDVLLHYEGVKAAVEEAEDEIAAALEASNKGAGGGSLLRARLNMISSKKVEQEMAALKATQLDLETKMKQEEKPAFYDCSEELLLSMAKEEWEKHHQHRYIQIAPFLPIYCCLCRRRKWELWRLRLEQEESDFRATYSNRYNLKVKTEELRLIREQEGADENTLPRAKPESGALSEINISSEVHDHTSGDEDVGSSASFNPRDEDDKVVLQLMRTLVLMTERIHSQDGTKAAVKPREHQVRRPVKQVQTGSSKRNTKKKKKKRAASREGEIGGDSSDELDELQMEMKRFECEDRERRLMVAEDSSMHIFLERNRRSLERPRLLQEDAAHNAYIRLISHCINPSSLLYRLQVERCLSFSPPQSLVLLMIDAGVVSNDGPCERYILHTVPCRTEQEASFIYQQVKITQEKLKSPFVASPVSGAKHTYQYFSESGMLIECWPVVFVVVKYFVQGSWSEAFQRALVNRSVSSFAHAEETIIRTFRDVAAGLAAMHSNGILHLNFNLNNIYLQEPMESAAVNQSCMIRIGGLLSFKRGFHEGHLRSGDMAHCTNPAITPPEATNGNPVSGKADVWMLGCALYEALMMWQRHELKQLGIGADAGSAPTTVFRLKKLADVLQEIPLATSGSVRSLLRMLLQPNPSQRPQMSQVVDILSFAGKRTSFT